MLVVTLEFFMIYISISAKKKEKQSLTFFLQKIIFHKIKNKLAAIWCEKVPRSGLGGKWFFFFFVCLCMCLCFPWGYEESSILHNNFCEKQIWVKEVKKPFSNILEKGATNFTTDFFFCLFRVPITKDYCDYKICRDECSVQDN